MNSLMQKVAVISDMHGNAVALEAVLAALQTQEIDGGLPG
jgi:hypothetical protein